MDTYGDQNPDYRAINLYPEYFKYGSILPDMQYISSVRNTYEELYEEINDIFGLTLTYYIDMSNIPDPEIHGSYSFGINTHDYRYAFKFAHYLLDQANADPSDGTALVPYDGDLWDPPGVDPGCVGQNNCVPRGQKLALALGYYSHLVQDLVNHNFLVPKATAESGLAELNLITNESAGLGHIPGIQSHFVIETMHDYRLGYEANAAVADLVHDDFWISTDQFEPSVPLVIYPGTTGYTGLNPSLDFFWEVLNKWYTENPAGLPDEFRVQQLISKVGFTDECSLWKLSNRFYPEMVGHGSLAEVTGEWIGNHVDGSVGYDLAFIILMLEIGQPGAAFTG